MHTTHDQPEFNPVVPTTTDTHFTHSTDTDTTSTDTDITYSLFLLGTASFTLNMPSVFPAVKGWAALHMNNYPRRKNHGKALIAWMKGSLFNLTENHKDKGEIVDAQRNRGKKKGELLDTVTLIVRGEDWIKALLHSRFPHPEYERSPPICIKRMRTRKNA